MGAVTEIKGFHVLKVKLPESDGKHYMYFRKHEVKGAAGQDISGRLLFVYNTPVATTVQVWKKYLQQVAVGATVESYISSLLDESKEDLYLDLTKLTSDLTYDTPESSAREVAQKLPAKCGIVTFIDKASAQLAFGALKKLAGDFRTTNWPVPTLGSHFFLERVRARRYEPAELARSVAEALELFNRAEQETKEELQRQTEIVDEDGFTLVVGSHTKTKAGILGKQKRVQTEQTDKTRKKMKRKEKEDFYRFQLREKKKAEMTELLNKFKLDQERVKTMRERKKFKPY